MNVDTSRPATVGAPAPVVNTPPAIGSPAFLEWACHDSVSGHARNALTLLAFLEPSDADAAAQLVAITRRVAAVIALLEACAWRSSFPRTCAAAIDPRAMDDANRAALESLAVFQRSAFRPLGASPLLDAERSPL